MEETKLTVRVPRQVLEDAKRYAREHDTTVTRLISQYLQRVSTAGHPLADAPIVRRLSGTLPRHVTIDDYRKHLEEKYGGEA
ncbi:MAG: DUF6364 family protein [Anaerolineae bacterium]|nr:DUF6364 family protein [Anaerolineae bacterium]